MGSKVDERRGGRLGGKSGVVEKSRSLEKMDDVEMGEIGGTSSTVGGGEGRAMDGGGLAEGTSREDARDDRLHMGLGGRMMLLGSGGGI
jgi:hypothetical protein